MSTPGTTPARSRLDDILDGLRNYFTPGQEAAVRGGLCDFADKVTADVAVVLQGVVDRGREGANHLPTRTEHERGVREGVSAMVDTLAAAVEIWKRQQAEVFERLKGNATLSRGITACRCGTADG